MDVEPAAAEQGPAAEQGLGARAVFTRYGAVRGYADGEVFSWKGIPYAAPPTGKLRFRSPQPPAPWDGVREAKEFGPAAPQGRDNPVPIDPDLVIDEDCLSLNVWAPEPDGTSRPVMVWIHGGAYCLGSSAQSIYDGRLLAERGGTVVVTINYRVGAFGFLDLTSFSTPDHVFESNVGLRDQIAALAWVRDCIADFGGDPNNVTAFGESSGAGSITTLMTSPHAEGLFHRAIVQSPPATSVYGPERGAVVAARYLEILDLTPDRIGELRELPLENLIKASDMLVNEVPVNVPGTLAMAPVVDGDIVPRYPVAAFQKGFSHRIPLIIGTNKDEMSIFRLMRSSLVPVSAETVEQMLLGIAHDHPDLPAVRLAEIIANYPDRAKPKGAMAISRDAAFRMPSLWIADGHSRHSPTWLYRFDYATPMLKAARVGAAHATELPYVFGNFGTFNLDPTFWLGGRKAAMEVSVRVQRRWLAFSRDGIPVALDGSKHWPQYDSTLRRSLLIDATDSLVSDPDEDLRAAWGDRVVGFS